MTSSLIYNYGVACSQVTVLSYEAPVTHTASDRLADPVAVRRTITCFHAVITEVALGTDCGYTLRYKPIVIILNITSIIYIMNTSILTLGTVVVHSVSINV